MQATHRDLEGSLAVAPRADEAPESAGIVPRGSLSSYMGQIRRYPLLTREQEHELAVAYSQRGDRKAAHRLLTSNLRLVVKIAHEYRRAHAHLEDLVQEGNLGLFMAVKKYDPDRGVKLSTYAAYWIRAYILKFILDNARLVRLGTTQAQRKLFFGLRKQQQKLAAQGIEASPSALAEAMSVPEREVVEMDQRMSRSDHSLDALTRPDDEGSGTFLDQLAGPTEGRPDWLTENREVHTRLRKALRRFRTTLKGRDLDILRERILSEAPDTLQEIGLRYGISRERARQLESRLMQRLTTYLEEEFREPSQAQ